MKSYSTRCKAASSVIARCACKKRPWTSYGPGSHRFRVANERQWCCFQQDRDPSSLQVNWESARTRLAFTVVGLCPKWEHELSPIWCGWWTGWDMRLAKEPFALRTSM